MFSFRAYAVLGLLFLLAGCGEEKVINLDIPLTPPVTSESFSGSWSGSGSGVFTGGEASNCKVALETEHTPGALTAKKLNVTCENGLDFQLDQAVTFSIRPNPDSNVLAFDLYYKEAKVGWINFDNSAFTVDYTDQGFAVRIYVSRTADGLYMDYTIMQADRFVIFDLKGANLK